MAEPWQYDEELKSLYEKHNADGPLVGKTIAELNVFPPDLNSRRKIERRLQTLGFEVLTTERVKAT